MNEELISIIVPVYNVEPYLSHCLNSIANQTYANIEVILVDDGSTDFSGDICDNFCQKDSRFTAIHQENQGLPGARNSGLKIAKGNYISFVDSDDYIHPQMMETLIHSIKSSKCEVGMVREKQVYGSDDMDSRVDIITPHIVHQDRLIASLFDTSNPEIGNKYMFAWNKLYKKKVLEGIYFNQVLNEDLDFNLRVFLRVESIAYVDAPLYYYFQREGSILNNEAARKYRAIDIIPDYLTYLSHIPETSPTYRSYCLRRLLKKILSVRYEYSNTPLKEYVKEKAKNVSDTALQQWSFS